MYVLTLVLYGAIAMVIATEELTGISTRDYRRKQITRNDDFINLHRLQYAKIVQDHDIKMENFGEYYSGRLEGIKQQLNMVSSSLVQMEERLNPLQLLSDFSKRCVIKYRSAIPTVTNTKASINSCIVAASNQVSSLLNSPLSTRNLLQNYHTNYFEKEILNCDKKFDNTTANFTTCISAVISNTDSYTISSQKNFDVQMDAAECTGKANIKRAVDCLYTIQFRTISQIGEANVLINTCLLGKDECATVNSGFTCNENYDLQVDYKNETILNPLYGRQNHTGCLMLNLH